MKTKKVLIFSVMGLVLWTAWGSEAVAKKNSDREKVKEFVTAYYEVHTEDGKDMLSDYVTDAESAADEMLVLDTCLNLGVEKYDIIEVAAYPLSDGISWVAATSYELIVDDFDIGIPGLTILVVQKQENGTFKICEDFFDDTDDSKREELQDEIEDLVYFEIYDKIYDVNLRYNTIVSENSDIMEWVLNLSDEVTQARASRGENLPEPKNDTSTDMRDTYVVREGDCLWNIAEEEFGDGMYWTGIYEANRNLIGDNPDLLYVGLELKIIKNIIATADQKSTSQILCQ